MNRIKALLALFQSARAQFDHDIATWNWKVRGIERRKAERKPYPGLDGDELRARLREVNAERVEPSVAVDTRTAG
jgi:hypothetical protein